MASRKKDTASRARRGGTRGGQAGLGAIRLQGAANDILGLVLAVIAVAMVVALTLPSSAPVTRVTGELLVMLFGTGAILVPAALLVYALTFFIGRDKLFSGRVALGLVLVILAVLSIVSITFPGAQNDRSIVLVHEVLRARGGYVGGGIAWALLGTVGREVGIVILVGIVAAGIVVCGFSISGAVTRLRNDVGAARATLQEAAESRRLRREELRAQREAEQALAYQDDYDDYDDYYDEGYDDASSSLPKTSYIGNRTSTVLTRNIASEAAMGRGQVPATEVRKPAEPLSSILGDAVSALVGRREHPDIDVDLVQPASADFAAQEPYDVATTAPEASSTRAVVDDGTIPDFLLPKDDQPAKKKAKPRRKASKRTSRASAASSETAAPPTAPAEAETHAVSDANVKVRVKAAVRPGDNDETYALPPLSMLSSNPQSAQSASSKAELDQTMAKLQGTLREFGLSSRVVDYIAGPLVTTFRIEMGEGERVNKIRNLEDDIALTLAAEKVRIFAPIPGTSFVGIEIPNKTRQNVHLGDVLPHAKGGPLEVAIGRDSAGRPVIADIAKMPHMLVAGTTGSGKSVMINSMIMSLLMRSTPKQVRLIMVDPKRVEFKGYNGIPHLYVPVVTEPRQAASALQWAVSEMERRLKVFERAGARNITVYNKMCTDGKLSEMDNPPEPMPYLVIVIDELSDLMMVAGKDVEASIVRIAQLARAAGIHLVIATQRPSANVVTGLIKSNIDSRVALKVSSGIDSRVILDETGADRLLGNGDMLFKDRGLAAKRVLGCYTSDPEIESVVDFIREQGEPDYHEEILSAVVPGQPGGASKGGIDDEDDPLIWEAAQIVVESQLGSTSGLQRRLKVGYARAGRIMDMLESKGVVGPASGSKPREVLLDEEGLEDLRTQEARYREV